MTEKYELSDFYFDLPEELIAQVPLKVRSDSRMMRVNRENKEIKNDLFRNLPEILGKNDLIVFNNTRVMPARLFGTRVSSGAKTEFLLLKRLTQDRWETLVKPGKSATKGKRFTFGDILTCEVEEVKEDGNRIIKFEYDGVFEEILDRLGEMPLPPYIHEKLEDKERYQTVYSKEEGSAAAPTAGLHFTDEIIEKIRENGCDTAFITLHVGLGTFRPVKSKTISEHHMHSEYYTIDRENAEKIEKARLEGKRIIAVGTTTIRTLESVMRDHGCIKEVSGWTDIFIFPGFRFRIINGLLTNFHLPESTLIMLVSAFMGYDLTMEAYKKAVEDRYRFFSFGDCMLIE